MARITTAGESLIAGKLGTGQVLTISRFVFANVPGLVPQTPVNRAEVKPPAHQIVYTYTIPPENTGYVNPNQVVYSSMLGSDIGDFDFNWMGLESAEGVLFAVAYLPVQQKRRNIPPAQIGNNITRNVLVEFTGAQELTAITIDASTWQHDFTVRLAGIDERERLSNRDMFGRSCCLGGSLQVEKVGAGYKAAAGVGYVEGVRVYSSEAVNVPASSLPTTVWLDVVLERQLNDVVARGTIVCAAVNADYKDSLGVQHYCVPLADLTAQGVIDRRSFEAVNGPLVQHFAARTGDYPGLRARATTKVDVDLGNIPNAISDDPATNSSQILATTRAVQSVQVSVNHLEDGTVSAGKATQLTQGRNIAIHGAGTGNVRFDGSTDVSIDLTLADSGILPGVYSKVRVSSKGLVYGSEAFTTADIPNLPWSKITSGKPTTLAGYGITDGLHTGYNDQVPRFYSPNPGLGFTNAAIEIREAALAGGGQSVFEYAPRIGFHWGTQVGGDLAMNIEGRLCWSGQEIYHSGNFDPSKKANKATTLGGYGITDALWRGEFGLGGNVAPINGVDTIGLEGGFHSINGEPTSLAQYCSVLNMPYSVSTQSAQIGLQHGGTGVRIYARSSPGPGKWTPTVELFHTGNYEKLIPPGALVQSFSPTPPPGCLRTNGASVNRVAYARLFAAISTYYGAGDGATTFGLPDTRGLFIRDIDDGRGFDPGRGLATVQASQNLYHTHFALSSEAGLHSHPGSTANPGGEHTHTAPRASPSSIGTGYPNFTTASYAEGTTAPTNPAGSHSHSLVIAADGAHTHDVTVYPEGGADARPVNMATYFYIKY